MPLLHCQQLTRAPWFRNVDLKLNAGQVKVLMGPTGCGKSMLLRALADLDPIDAGSRWLGDKECLELSPAAWRRSVLFLHQSAPRTPGSVFDNLRATGGQSVEGQELNPFQLDLDQDSATLSGGQAQLLALTRALSSAPKVYLLDESTSALDIQTSERVEAALNERLQTGAAILWVTHDERIAERMGCTPILFEELSR